MAETPDQSTSTSPETLGETPNGPGSPPGFRVLPPEGPRMARGAVFSPPESTVSAQSYADFAGAAKSDGTAVPAIAPEEPVPATPSPNGAPNPAPAELNFLAPYEESDEPPVAAPVAAVAPPLPPLPPLGGPPAGSGPGGNGKGGGGKGGSGGGQPAKDNVPEKDVELGLFEHLSELRARILSCVYVVFGMSILTWNLGTWIQETFTRPIQGVLREHPGDKLISTHPAGFFMIYCEISVISAIIFTMPWILFQIWGFLEPALTRKERRYTLILVPFSIILFALGVALGYYISPMFYRYFVAFRPAGVAANWDYLDTIVLQFKLLLAFGISFQVPVITIFLNKAGLVSRNWLIEYWRHAVIVIFVVVAFITPTWDPLTMTICAVPPCILYGLSIWLIKWL